MVEKSLSDSVVRPTQIPSKSAVAFGEGKGGREYGNEYLSALRANWQSLENAITRWSALAVTAAFLFEIVITSHKTVNATILGFTLSDPRVLELGIPVVIAYLYYRIMAGYLESELFSIAHDNALAHLYPEIYETGLRRILQPSNSIKSSGDRLNTLTSPTKASTGAIYANGVWLLASVFVTPIFLAIAYAQVFIRLPVSNPWLWASLVFSGALVASGVVNIFAWLGG
jgi:hypothetical protein